MIVDARELLEYLDTMDNEVPVITDEFDAGWCEAVDQIREWIESHQEGGVMEGTLFWRILVECGAIR